MFNTLPKTQETKKLTDFDYVYPPSSNDDAGFINNFKSILKVDMKGAHNSYCWRVQYNRDSTLLLTGSGDCSLNVYDATEIRTMSRASYQPPNKKETPAEASCVSDSDGVDDSDDESAKLESDVVPTFRIVQKLPNNNTGGSQIPAAFSMITNGEADSKFLIATSDTTASGIRIWEVPSNAIVDRGEEQQEESLNSSSLKNKEKVLLFQHKKCTLPNFLRINNGNNDNAAATASSADEDIISHIKAENDRKPFEFIDKSLFWKLHQQKNNEKNDTNSTRISIAPDANNRGTSTATVVNLAFSPTNPHLLAVAGDSFVHLYDVETGGLVRSFKNAKGTSSGLEWSENGEFLAACSYSDPAVVYCVNTGLIYWTRKTAANGASSYGMTFSKNWKINDCFVAVANSDGSCLVANIKNEISKHNDKKDIEEAVKNSSSSSNSATTTTTTSSLLLLDDEESENDGDFHTIFHHSNMMIGVAISNSNRVVAVATYDCQVFLFDISTLKNSGTEPTPLYAFRVPPSQGVYSLAFSKNDRELALATVGGSLYVVDSIVSKMKYERRKMMLFAREIGKSRLSTEVFSIFNCCVLTCLFVA